MAESFDVFLSHNHVQKPWVTEFAKRLRRAGLSVFFDEDSIRPGEDTVGAIERGIQASKRIVLILSPEAVGSNWVSLETSLTIYDDPGAKERKLIPVLLEPVTSTR